MDPEEKKEEIIPEEIPAEIPTAEPVTEAPAEEPQPPEPKKHKYADRLSKAFPDRQFEKDEDFDSALDEHLDELEGYKERGTLANKRLIALFDAEPQVGDVVRDMINGASFREALARHMSPEDLTAIEGDPDYEGWSKNKAEREERTSKREARMKEREANLQVTQEAIDTFAAENNMSEEDAANFLGKLDQLIDDFNAGKISKEVLTTMKKAWDYDNDIATAKDEGEIAGKNQNIVAKKEAAQPIGDGIPKITSTSEIKEPAPREKSYFEGLSESINRKKVF